METMIDDLSNMTSEPMRKKKEFNTFRKAYDEHEPIYKAALRELERRVRELKRKNEGQAHLRIEYVTTRVKRPHSIIRKAHARGISGDKVFEMIEDIAGMRIVVNNIKDIEPLIGELKDVPGLSLKGRELHEDPDGYRALHIKAIYSLKFARVKHKVPCEIQVRSLMQDAWAILTHHDVYKNEASLPTLARGVSRHLSRVLNALDHIADEFRMEMETRVKAPNDLSPQARLDQQGIAFLYFEIFNEWPQEYENQYLFRVAGETEIETVGKAREGLREDVFKRLQTIHEKRFPIDMSNVERFEYGLRYGAQGRSAFSDFREKVEADWAEVETTARGEILSSMPETLEEFTEMLRQNDTPWEAIQELGGVRRCLRCGEKILVPSAAAEAVLDYYGDPATEVDLESLFLNFADPLAPETESVNTSGVCPYCDHMMSKND